MQRRSRLVVTRPKQDLGQFQSLIIKRSNSSFEMQFFLLGGIQYDNRKKYEIVNIVKHDRLET